MEARTLKVDNPGFWLMVKGGKTYRWTPEAWALLPKDQQDEYDYIGKNGASGEFVPIQHQAAPAQEVIPIKEEVPIKEEPIKDEPVVKTLEQIENEPKKEPEPVVVDKTPKKLEEIQKEVKKKAAIKKVIEPEVKKKVAAKTTDRAGLKEWFKGKDVTGYYDKMPTKKMLELYESQK